MDDNMSPIPETKPNPDPTLASNEAIARAVKAERDYVDGQIRIMEMRLNAIDEATKVLSYNVNRTPTLLQTAIKSLRQLMNEKFKSINDKLKAAESLRLEQKQDSKTGLDAALAAQKESASIQDINNQKAIDKSEKATAETIKTNQELATAKIDTLTKGQDELKLEVSKITAVKMGVIENRTEVRDNRAVIYATIGIGITILLAIVTVIGLVVSNN